MVKNWPHKLIEIIMKKKTFAFVFMLAFSMATFSQTSQDGRCTIENLMHSKMVKGADYIGDFTITDSDGVTWNLYEKLNLGKTIFLDLFFST